MEVKAAFVESYLCHVCLGHGRLIASLMPYVRTIRLSPYITARSRVFRKFLFQPFFKLCAPSRHARLFFSANEKMGAVYELHPNC